MPAVRPRPPQRRIGVALLGAINGSNQTFTTPEPFLNGLDTLALYYNGQRLVVADDYTLGESGGVGTGWDTVLMLFPPRAGDKLHADYPVG